MRKKILIGNWKMNKTCAETAKFCSELKAFKDAGIKKKMEEVDVGIAPTFISLKTFTEKLPNLICLSQNVNENESGAFTGEVSFNMLSEIGISWTLLGHSERRMYNNETDASINKKILACIAHKFTTVVCVGESLEEYKNGKSKSWIKAQIKGAFKNVPEKEVKKMVIAYEPIWSIGTGKNASPEIALDICSFIRKTIASLYSEATAKAVRILYGGSVKPDNIASYVKTKEIDGALVGGASLKPESFIELLKNY